ncbi:hypothetical protein GBA52_015125 [Prunus armeniaca]|nr:hypothetical protein GBA52_015125 [Prunus armeniaca]
MDDEDVVVNPPRSQKQEEFFLSTLAHPPHTLRAIATHFCNQPKLLGRKRRRVDDVAHCLLGTIDLRGAVAELRGPMSDDDSAGACGVWVR